MLSPNNNNNKIKRSFERLWLHMIVCGKDMCIWSIKNSSNHLLSVVCLLKHASHTIRVWTKKIYGNDLQ